MIVVLQLKQETGRGIPDQDHDGLSSNWGNEGAIRPYCFIAFVRACAGTASLGNILVPVIASHVFSP